MSPTGVHRPHFESHLFSWQFSTPPLPRDTVQDVWLNTNCHALQSLQLDLPLKWRTKYDTIPDAYVYHFEYSVCKNKCVLRVCKSLNIFSVNYVLQMLVLEIQLIWSKRHTFKDNVRTMLQHCNHTILHATWTQLMQYLQLLNLMILFSDKFYCETYS
jgi:hypothetical protein